MGRYPYWREAEPIKNKPVEPEFLRRLILDSTRSSGQGLVEFALILPVLILIFFGALDLGRAFHALIVITNAAREGARYGTLHADYTINNFNNIRSAAVNEAVNSGIVLNSSQVQVTCVNVDIVVGKCDRGEPITVTVQYNFYLVLGALFSNPIQFNRSVEMMVP